jgi:hypothetical protein
MRVASVFMMLTLLLLATSPAAFAVSAATGFINENAQLLVLGELVDVEALESDDFSASDIESFFYVDVKADSPSERSKNIRMHIEFSSLGQVIYESWTDEVFTLNQWQTSGIGNNGHYTNDQLDELESTDWFNEDLDRSTDFDAETLTGIIDGGNLAGGIYLIKVEVFEVLPNGNEVLIALAITPIQVSSPSRPQPITPLDGDEVTGYPIFMSWTGVGAEVSPMDVMLCIIEADPDNFDDPQTVIDNRNLSNSRYIGMPQFSDYHVYTGVSGTEQALTDGMTYVWMVTVSVSSAGGGVYEYNSSPTSFVFNDSGMPNVDGDPDNPDEEPGGGLAEEGFVNNPPRERDSDNPLPDPIFALLLQSGMSQSQINALVRSFEGFYVQDIKFDDQNGQTYPTLARKMNTPGLEVIAVIYEGEE